jgi:hypothetical protein
VLRGPRCFTVVEPVNQRLRPLPPGVVPEDFAALRAQWEFGHATEFVLFLVAFVCLVVSVLEHPAGGGHGRGFQAAIASVPRRLR